MRLSEQLHEALLDYGTIEKGVSTVDLRDGINAKQTLVRGRRQLSEQIGRLGPLIEQDRDLATQPDKQREFSQLFSAMRYALALHQADWPVVRIDEDLVAYRQSARVVQDKSAAFWSWCDAQFGLRNDQSDPEISIRSSIM